MNLISNECTAGFIHKRNHWQYGSPFMWTTVRYEDMLTFVTQYDNIDFSKFEIEREEPWNFYVRVDDKARIGFWLHFKFDKNATTPRIVGDNVYSCRIWEYIANKYSERAARMDKDPKFIISWHEWLGYTRDNIEHFLAQTFPHKTLIIMPYKEFANFKKENLEVIYDENMGKGGYFPNYFVNKYFKQMISKD